MRRDGVPHQRRHGDDNVTFAVVRDELAGAHVAVVDDVVIAVPVAGIPNAFAKLSNKTFNQDKSAPSFCRQVTARVPDMFCDSFLVKNNKIANNSTTTKARDNISPDFEIL
jgi:hypothetical protein